MSASHTLLGGRITRLENKALTATDRREITWLGIKIEELDAEYRDLQEEIV